MTNFGFLLVSSYFFVIDCRGSCSQTGEEFDALIMRSCMAAPDGCLKHGRCPTVTAFSQAMSTDLMACLQNLQGPSAAGAVESTNVSIRACPNTHAVSCCEVKHLKLDMQTQICSDCNNFGIS